MNSYLQWTDILIILWLIYDNYKLEKQVKKLQDELAHEKVKNIV